MQVRTILKSILPQRLYDFLRQIYRSFIFKRAFKQFMKNPKDCAHPKNPVLLNLIHGWGNEVWSALDEYLAACLNHALTSDGPILECGSGLSTLLIGAIATKHGRNHIALEHKPEWARRVRRYLNRYNLKSVVLCNPLKDYDSFCWYDVPFMSDNFSLVVCDGPPGSTKGGRYGLIPIMKERLKPGCVILLDDVDREQEREIANHWKAESGGSVEFFGSLHPYIKMTLTSSSTTSK